jgi:tetratricopeptide (TPR) repeat protein
MPGAQAVNESTLDTTQSAPDAGPASSSHPGEIGPGSVVGRHLVLHKLGAGGMGIVYAAYDPELDRKVALKLLLPGRGGTGRVRLLREAQALARLSHPHVVGIHDVGTMGEQVWLAMELVQGQTLGQWLERGRSWRDVLEVLRKAGEGLAAAHAVGLLHRDFKPDNVMVGDDGRVCVMDFGLARTQASEGSLGAELPPPSEERKSVLASDLTRVGAVVGTLRYMAPEQLSSKELTAAVDQFSFCVTLWEALYGERPFEGDSTEALAVNVLAGRLRSPPKRRAVPGWLRRACERGLAVDPEQRWPSMNALLDTLAKGGARARMRKGLAVLGVLALLGGGFEARRRWDVARRVATCEAAGAEVGSAWSPERAQALRRALTATEVSFAPATADKVTAWLDRQAEQWREARVEACLDAEVRDRGDADTLDRSLWCLDARRMELESLVDELTRADADVARKAVAAASALAPVAACRDPEVLETLALPPEADRDALRAVRADVVRAANLERAGRHAKGLELAQGALARAQALAWPPLAAEARLQLGVLLERTGAYPRAAAELEQAYFDASKGVAPEVVFDAAWRLVYTVGVLQARHADGLHWARLADVALEDVPDGEHLRRASLFTSLATVHRLRGDYAEARSLHEQALGILEQALGTEHLRVAASLINLANVHASTGNDDDAAKLYERALAIQEQELGSDDPDLAATLNNLANVYAATGDHGSAKHLLQRTVSILEQSLGPTHPSVATGLNNLADEHYVTHDYEEAKRLSQRALSIWEQTLGATHPNVGAALTNLANASRATGDEQRARALLERALSIFEQALGPDHPHVAAALVTLGEIALAQERPTDAIALAQRAVSLREKAGVPPEELAAARFVLARALWDAPIDGGRDRARAIASAEQARDAVSGTGGVGSGANEVLGAVEPWLAEHREGAPAPP